MYIGALPVKRQLILLYGCPALGFGIKLVSGLTSYRYSSSFPKSVIFPESSTLFWSQGACTHARISLGFVVVRGGTRTCVGRVTITRGRLQALLTVFAPHGKGLVQVSKLLCHHLYFQPISFPCISGFLVFWFLRGLGALGPSEGEPERRRPAGGGSG